MYVLRSRWAVSKMTIDSALLLAQAQGTSHRSLSLRKILVLPYRGCKLGTANLVSYGDRKLRTGGTLSYIMPNAKSSLSTSSTAYITASFNNSPDLSFAILSSFYSLINLHSSYYLPHPITNMTKEHQQNGWANGFFDCCSPAGLCLKTFCCPCIVYGKTQARLHNKLDDYSCCNGSVSPYLYYSLYHHFNRSWKQ